MWLSSSSVGRKFIMAVTGAVLVLFVTFHCLMNAICICWPTAYNSICMFLGANWYALLASAALAAFIVIHIIYACMLTIQNRRARGNQAYAVSKRPATVEWSSNNMLVLGIVILAFLVVHLIQFWAKMQLQEIRGDETMIPATAGTLFIQEAFSLVWTPIVYIIGFVALWFHMNHGFWSMFQSVGWDSTVWIPRLKKIACWWTSIVILCFIAQAVVFTVKSHEGYYKVNPELRAQYKDMVAEVFERDYGPDAAQMAQGIRQTPVDQLMMMKNQLLLQAPSAEEFVANSPQIQQGLSQYTNPLEREEKAKGIIRMLKAQDEFGRLLYYLNDEEVPAFQPQPQGLNIQNAPQQPATPEQQPQKAPKGDDKKTNDSKSK